MKTTSLRLSRRTVVRGAAALAAAPVLTLSDVLTHTGLAGTPDSPSLTSAFAADRATVRATRITAAGITTDTAMPEILLNTTLSQFLYRKATSVAIYSAPAGHAVPARAFTAAAPEFLFIMKGAATLSTRHGTVRCGRGSVTLLEGGAIAETADGQGYTALRVRLAAS